MNRNALKSPADVPVCRHTCDGIYIRHKDYFRKYLYSDLLWVKASGCYCDLYFRDKSRLTVAFPLAVVISRLPGDLFVRLHHSYVVSLYDIETFFGNTVRIAHQDFPIGPSYRAGFLARLNILSGGRPFFPDGSDDLATN
ncbi:LytTR family transcriptional regulator [Odoribacter splanchnicus]|jgi:DNA-binding LytR/AlgR family response regulator|uniref:LytTR family transcriptional regulator n=2 Tax=Odoribacter splanchnicus TaxID=28118 RepID=A0A413I336_9BACT|nr:LytTR family DNA-binding domain-containing protein [Odoribacter splanchnicus]MBS1320827.1 LytTR family transcriptional regulator [Parabacteroides sp.]MDB9205642.1 LytTR family DNA-binding domain-containing protein [Odoribacter splanchnicus]RGU71173.1 LytTR family transcriptional regulator [Odoribacter splanchnicus]RGY01764.1 LytTR family transcriptional regulator [Odoribacter splanchnicus]RHA73113.1 LytTR family transcriptional regulator [Odoribacter splanchnicus]